MTPIEVVVVVEPVPDLLLFGNAFVEDPDVVSTRAEVDRPRAVESTGARTGSVTAHFVSSG
jgi:hypothetical protein